ncbi:MAG: ABC transporter substrate-binding protein, partial [Cyanobacteria bacterium J06642_11]
VVIVYNHNSLYSRSYHDAVLDALSPHQDRLQVVGECDFMGDDYARVQAYLRSLTQQSFDILLVIPDGGLEPNSLRNLGLISRLTAGAHTVAGPATLHHPNVLQWLQESAHETAAETATGASIPSHPHLVACVPWQPKSSTTALDYQFCQLGERLWGLANLTWRTATTFDAGLLIAHGLQQHRPENAQEFLPQLSHGYKQLHKTLLGATGELCFCPNGDRQNPPAVIVSAAHNSHQWQWQPG